ncbi:MAG: RagB/SusD family nutrient uptake outer membrane protein [Leadbetterella sp.]|nr:RagB/SusD family nutrient uptake outer membrane protein [Leadbetterella sp.]
MKRIINKILAAGVLLVSHACTDLTEKTYDVIPTESFGKTPAQQAALIGPLYNSVGNYWPNLFWVQPSTDEMVIPTRGGDWGDGGQHVRMYTHTWEAIQDNGRFNGIWNWCYNAITAINLQMASVTEPSTLAELKALRAFFHYVAMDNFGNVIIANGVSSGNPPQSTRAQVYAFIEKELLEAYPNLSETVGGAYYTRFNKYVVDMLLAKLYLNAEVYTGTPQWAKVVVHTSRIIDSGKFSLPADFFSTFKTNNQGSPEIILATAYDKTKRQGFNIQMPVCHYRQRLEFNLGGDPWNGPCAVPSFYHSFSDKDIRKNMWMVGQRYAADGTPLTDDGLPLVLDPEVKALVMPAGAATRIQGARAAKYEIQRNNTETNQDNDFVIFRLGDAILMRGEANLRLGNMTAALADVNIIRERAGVPAYTASTLTLTELLAERGREMAWELHRRQDLIRFGKFNSGKDFMASSPAHTRLFPIPNDQIVLNPNLKQNPGY